MNGGNEESVPDWVVELGNSVADGTVTPEEAVQISEEIEAEESGEF